MKRSREDSEEHNYQEPVDDDETNYEELLDLIENDTAEVERNFVIFFLWGDIGRTYRR